MITTYTLTPGVAAYIDVKSDDGKWDQTVIFMSQATGAVIGSRELPLARSTLPLQVQAAINEHFAAVFALEHETWKGKGPSPRAQYCDALLPWRIYVEEPHA
jgi:hypothetical protein